MHTPGYRGLKVGQAHLLQPAGHLPLARSALWGAGGMHIQLWVLAIEAVMVRGFLKDQLRSRFPV